MLRGIRVLPDEEIERYISASQVDTAVLAMPKEAVEKMADRLYAVGIRNFWNFSHYDISRKYDDVVVENVHISDSLMTLCYRINEKNTNR